MADLTANTPLDWAESSPTDWYDYAVAAGEHLYQGMPIMKDLATGYAKKLAATASGEFLGICEHEVDNSTAKPSPFGGATIGDNTSGSCTVNVRRRGQVVLTVAAGGTLAGDRTDIDKTVYATDTNTYTGSSAANAIKVGKIVDFISGTKYLVEIEADSARSL